ncbi:MAG: hypothetical protein J1D86_06355 [Alistipes sp.]|nr:hypothetical protein [Alistipes sp.]
MIKLEGIIYKTFNHYVVLRGFAPIKDLAAISHRPESYQRPAIESHKKDIIEFLDSGEYKYFPEITLACRVNKYSEFAQNIGIDNAVDRDDAQYVDGLKILSERLPYEGYRARHANLSKNNNTDLVRVDGNHRLEPFDVDNEKIWEETNADKKQLGSLIVPFTVIFSDREFGDKFEAGIFHNINFKQEPLRQEASLKIISDLNVFDAKEKLGDAYPLALQLINEVKIGRFDNIYWLNTTHNINESYYRTSCLRLSELLLYQQILIKDKELPKCSDALHKNAQCIEQVQEKISSIGREIATLIEQIDGAECNNSEYRSSYLGRKQRMQLTELHNQDNSLSNELRYLEQQREQLENRYQKLTNFVESVNVDSILTAINSLNSIYQKIGEDYGNISFFCVLVYYHLLDVAQLHSFIDWAVNNGINKIITPDDISRDAAQNLIAMFERIYQTKKNEIFISMQFGDSQSELIYEKIARAIERFNAKHSSIHLNATPIRIDRTVESSTFSIQDKILAAIQSCSLIIADLSSANINVYHEIGYAMGIAESHNMIPNIILLYKEDTDHNREHKDVDKFIGFNLRNLSQLRFKDYSQLVNGLVARLEKHYGV